MPPPPCSHRLAPGIQRRDSLATLVLIIPKSLAPLVLPPPQHPIQASILPALPLVSACTSCQSFWLPQRPGCCFGRLVPISRLHLGLRGGEGALHIPLPGGSSSVVPPSITHPSPAPRWLDGGSACAGQVVGLMMANLPKVGTAPAAGSPHHQLWRPYGQKQLFQLLSLPRCVRRDTGALQGTLSRSAANYFHRVSERRARCCKKGASETAGCQLSLCLTRMSARSAVTEF